MEPVILHRASWVVPVSSGIIADGAVACTGEEILDVAAFHELKEKFPRATVRDHGSGILTPALINTHIHLELSHIPLPRYKEKITGFTDWIEALLSLREEMGSTGETVVDAAKKVLHQQYQLGVIALGDIGNTELGNDVGCDFPGTLLHFNERLGRSPKTRRAILEQVKAAPVNRLYTAHAPYSTHGELIQELKKRAAANNHPFPIHVAEPPSENDLLCCGTGDLYTFLKGRNFIDDSYEPPAGIDNPGSVRYLHDLGVLDARTICVHCIHVSPAEVQILAETGAHVCLCPGSNRYLEVGRAPVGLFLENDLLPALGTDSMASNPELSLWREMRIIQEDNPAVDPGIIFAMATRGGAQALGLADKYGSLAPGKSSSFLFIPVTGQITASEMVYDYLVRNENIKPVWVSEQ